MKRTQIQSIILILIIVISSIIIITGTIKAQPPTVVNGYVYIDGTITVPEDLYLTFPSNTSTATLNDDGRYIIVFSGIENGSVGEFTIVYNGDSYTPAETVTIDEDELLYTIDVHVTISGSEEPAEEPEEDTNIQPIADAGGPYYQLVNTAMTFDASASYDPDGDIVGYEWQFGDNTTATDEAPMHTYSAVGTFKVTLTIIDDDDNTDIDITYVSITEMPNDPPAQPVLTGPSSGSVTILYNYTIVSTDSENDTIQYIIDWGDETTQSTSKLLENGSLWTVSHAWAYPGIYTVTAYALDENHVISTPTKMQVLINAIYCDDWGYMVDFTTDGIYDLFHSNITGEETPVGFVSGVYHLDDDNDGAYEYTYDVQTRLLSAYSGETPAPESDMGIFNQPLVLAILLMVVIAIIVVFVIGMVLFSMKRKKEKSQKTPEKTHEKTKDTKAGRIQPQPPASSSDNHEQLREKIDQLFTKK